MLILNGEPFTSGRSRFLDHRLPVTLVADDGESLEVEAPFFVSPDWRGGTFLGYTGLLDRLRIALDSPANFFYFGSEG